MSSDTETNQWVKIIPYLSCEMDMNLSESIYLNFAYAPNMKNIFDIATVYTSSILLWQCMILHTMPLFSFSLSQKDDCVTCSQKYPLSKYSSTYIKEIACETHSPCHYEVSLWVCSNRLPWSHKGNFLKLFQEHIPCGNCEKKALILQVRWLRTTPPPTYISRLL